jgi:hypothetical protein
MKYALVTGAASGIGAEFARQLAERGYTVLKIDRTAIPDDPMALQLDLTAEDATARVMRWLDDMEVLPDLWVNNAGVFDFREVCDLTPERLDLYVNLHCRSLTQLCRAVAPRMAARGSGEILNMSSMSCWMPMPGIAMYAATKAYIRAFSRALRLELKDSGVSVTVACPGGIATDLFGLPRNLQRLGVKLGALQTPQRFVIGAIRATLRHRKQHINGLIINRLAIVAVGLLPDFLRIQVKRLLLDRWKQQGKR